jgi:hypothetical protein
MYKLHFVNVIELFLFSIFFCMGLRLLFALYYDQSTIHNIYVPHI